MDNTAILSRCFPNPTLDLEASATGDFANAGAMLLLALEMEGGI